MTPIWGGACIIAALFGVRDRKGAIYSKAPREWSKALLFVAGARVIEHDKHHKMGEQHIFIANHVSWFDVFAMAAHLRWFKFVAKAELFRIPLFGRAMRSAGMVPIERQNRKAAFGAYKEAAQRIHEGASVVVFAEGTRGYSYALRPFKKGPFVLAIEAQAPIVPVLILGAMEIHRRGGWRIRSGEIHLHYLPAISSAGMTYEDRDLLARQAYTAIAAKLEAETGIVSPPPR
ncbi:MAG: 1-acyl-sn-glycerol-3-phosphate acyltransferase [Gemmatimonadaceae bacterium]|nr:1-acyl-sn-glycerol-3-phosphate acyltransferase [Gemmatimonadaceae bacterium]